MNQIEQFNNYMACNQAPAPLFMGGFSYMDNFCENNMPVNVMSEKLNTENKEFSSKIFAVKEKNSDNSETLSVYANAEEETGVSNIEASRGYKKGEDHSLLNAVLKEIKSSSLDELLEELVEVLVHDEIVVLTH